MDADADVDVDERVTEIALTILRIFELKVEFLKGKAGKKIFENL